MFKDTNDGQTYFDPEAERKAREPMKSKCCNADVGADSVLLEDGLHYGLNRCLKYGKYCDLVEPTVGKALNVKCDCTSIVDVVQKGKKYNVCEIHSEPTDVKEEEHDWDKRYCKKCGMSGVCLTTPEKCPVIYPQPPAMQDLIKESASELEKLKCINGAMYFGSYDNPCDCGDMGCINQATFDDNIKELKDWHTKQMERLAISLYEEEINEIGRMEKLDPLLWTQTYRAGYATAREDLRQHLQSKLDSFKGLLDK